MLCAVCCLLSAVVVVVACYCIVDVDVIDFKFVVGCCCGLLLVVWLLDVWLLVVWSCCCWCCFTPAYNTKHNGQVATATCATLRTTQRTAPNDVSQQVKRGPQFLVVVPLKFNTHLAYGYKIRTANARFDWGAKEKHFIYKILLAFYANIIFLETHLKTSRT